MLRRVQDVENHAPPEGVSTELWKETLRYYGEQKNFSTVLQWVKARVEQFSRILEDLTPTKPAPATFTEEQIKKHTKAVIAVMTQVAMNDLLQTEGAADSPHLRQIAIKTARALFDKHRKWCKERAEELNLGDPSALVDKNVACGQGEANFLNYFIFI